MPKKKSPEINLYFDAAVEPKMREPVNRGILLAARHLGGVSLRDCGDICLPAGDFLEVSAVDWDDYPAADMALVATEKKIIRRNNAHQPEQVAGLAVYGPRLALVTAAKWYGSQGVQNTTAHEIGHLAGLKDSGSESHDTDHYAHCRDADCVMHYLALSTHMDDLRQSFLEALTRRMERLDTEVAMNIYEEEVAEFLAKTVGFKVEPGKRQAQDIITANHDTVIRRTRRLDFCSICIDELHQADIR